MRRNIFALNSSACSAFVRRPREQSWGRTGPFVRHSLGSLGVFYCSISRPVRSKLWNYFKLWSSNSEKEVILQTTLNYYSKNEDPRYWIVVAICSLNLRRRHRFWMFKSVVVLSRRHWQMASIEAFPTELVTKCKVIESLQQPLRRPA